MKKNILFVLSSLIFLYGCSVMYKNAIYDDFSELKPKKIGVLISHKSILEIPAGHDFQFSELSIYPDTIDQGSSLAYRSNSTAEDFIKTSDVYDVFKSVLLDKNYDCYNVDNSFLLQPDTIKTITKNLYTKYKDQIDAILFIDYSPMFNKYFASKGIRGNKGYSCYYRYALFDLFTGKLLIRYKNVLHLDFYSKPNPSISEMANDITSLMIEDLEEYFPNVNHF